MTEVWGVTGAPFGEEQAVAASGDRGPTSRAARRLVHGVVGVFDPGPVSLLLTDQSTACGRALLTHFGH